VSSTLNSFGKDLPIVHKTSGIALNLKGNDCLPNNNNNNNNNNTSSMKSSQSLSMSGTISISKMDKENVV